MRIVVKLGTSTLTHPTGRINIRRVEKLCKVLCDIKNAGHELILVSSGAIGLGVGKLNMKERPTDMDSIQAAAAVGQCELMYMYDKLFMERNHVVAQILLTGRDFEDQECVSNFESALHRLLDLGVTPVVNENDCISTSEISVGDNDTLGAIVAIHTQADLLIILSDINGLFREDPRVNPDAEKVDYVYKVDEQIRSLAGNKGSSLSVGGMATKINADKMVMEKGIDMVIANGHDPEVLYHILEGKTVGTRFVARKGQE